MTARMIRVESDQEAAIKQAIAILSNAVGTKLVVGCKTPQNNADNLLIEATNEFDGTSYEISLSRFKDYWFPVRAKLITVDKPCQAFFYRYSAATGGFLNLIEGKLDDEVYNRFDLNPVIVCPNVMLRCGM